MSQASLFQAHQQSASYFELCNALYERELRALALVETASAKGLQGRLKSLPYYVKRTADLMTQAETPLDLDIQNASWSSKQSNKIPLTGQDGEDIWAWYQSITILPGLVVPVLKDNKIYLDSIDRIDSENQRFRGNAYGWFDQTRVESANLTQPCLLKPNKKVMAAACAGHVWSATGKLRPQIPTLRELLLSCSVNWRNFKRPLAI